MNRKLMEAITKHIFSNLAVIPSTFVNFDVTKPLISKEFLLNEKIPFTFEDDRVSNNKVWGCQVLVSQQEIKLLLADCSQEESTPEYALLVSLKDAPLYGIYLVNNPEFNSEALIACSLDGKAWMECQTYLQATFLAGMEQIRDVGTSWNKVLNYKEQFESLLSFIKFHHMLYEGQYERKES